MKIYSVGMNPIWTATLREHGYEIVSCSTLPDTEIAEAIFITDSDCRVDELSSLRQRYPKAEILYAYTQRGIAGWHTVKVLCEQQGIRFLRPGIGSTAMIDMLDGWYKEQAEDKGNLIGIFGVTAGSGVTRIGATLAQSLARTGKKVALLGLNLYSAGWEKETQVSLDRWRQRLVSKMLQPEDFGQLVQMGFSYLPGNYDWLATLDYGEDEIDHLLNSSQQAFDIVLADFGSIPESAAWLVGMQRSSFRIVVTHPRQMNSLLAFLKLAKDIGIDPELLFAFANRTGGEDVSLKTLSATTGMQPFYSLSDKGHTTELVLPLGKKELDALDEALRPFMTAMGLQTEEKRKGWFNV